MISDLLQLNTLDLMHKHRLNKEFLTSFVTMDTAQILCRDKMSMQNEIQKLAYASIHLKGELEYSKREYEKLSGDKLVLLEANTKYDNAIEQAQTIHLENEELKKQLHQSLKDYDDTQSQYDKLDKQFKAAKAIRETFFLEVRNLKALLDSSNTEYIDRKVILSHIQEILRKVDEKEEEYRKASE
ncbi:MAG: hypothetical protein AAF518_20475 [Spirochaetota bacterium]